MSTRGGDIESIIKYLRSQHLVEEQLENYANKLYHLGVRTVPGDLKFLQKDQLVGLFLPVDLGKLESDLKPPGTTLTQFRTSVPLSVHYWLLLIPNQHKGSTQPLQYTLSLFLLIPNPTYLLILFTCLLILASTVGPNPFSFGRSTGSFSCCILIS